MINDPPGSSWLLQAVPTPPRHYWRLHRIGEPELLHSSIVPEPLRPPNSDLVVARYATGWGYAAVEWEHALAGIGHGSLPAKPSTNTPEDHSRLLKQREGAAVWFMPVDFGKRNTKIAHRQVVLKVETLDGWWAVARSLLRLTKAHRQWRGAELLEKNGFRAARGVAIIRGRSGAGPVEMLALEALPGQTLLECLADAAPGTGNEHRLARAIGRHIAALCLAGLVNRDSKPSNLLIEWKKNGQPSITVLDTVAITRQPFARKPFWIEEGLTRMARDLLLEPAGCNTPVRRTLAMRVLHACFDRLHPDQGSGRWRTWRDRRWREVAAMIEAHGDPTPQDDPMNAGVIPPETTTSPDRQGGVSEHR
jgi:lipopolysaccharide kinase (Kdo/WaaP) family protein